LLLFTPTEWNADGSTYLLFVDGYVDIHCVQEKSKPLDNVR